MLSFRILVIRDRAGVVGTGGSGVGVVVGSSMSIIMKRMLLGADALNIWINIVFVCSF